MWVAVGTLLDPGPSIKGAEYAVPSRHPPWHGTTDSDAVAILRQRAKPAPGRHVVR